MPPRSDWSLTRLIWGKWSLFPILNSVCCEDVIQGYPATSSHHHLNRQTGRICTVNIACTCDAHRVHQTSRGCLFSKRTRWCIGGTLEWDLGCDRFYFVLSSSDSQRTAGISEQTNDGREQIQSSNEPWLLCLGTSPACSWTSSRPLSPPLPPVSGLIANTNLFVPPFLKKKKTLNFWEMGIFTDPFFVSFCDAAHLFNCYSSLSNGWNSGPVIEHPLTALPPLCLPALPMRTVPIPSVILLAHHVRIEAYSTASGKEKEIEIWGFKVKGEET